MPLAINTLTESIPDTEDDVEDVAEVESPVEEDREKADFTSPGGVQYTRAQQQQVSRWMNLVKVPSFLRYWYARYDYDRRYVSDESMLLDDRDTVSVNYLYRNTQLLTANLLARDPQLAVKPTEILGDHPPELDRYGRTLEILTRKLMEKTGVAAKTTAGVADTSSVGWAIYKLIPQEDFKLDPLGSQRMNDELDNLARVDWFRQRIAGDDLNEDSPEWQDYLDTQRQVAKFLVNKVQQDLRDNPPGIVPLMDPMTQQPIMDPVLGTPITQPDPVDPRNARLEALEQGQVPEDMDLPEIARYIGFVLDRIMPEDFRFDWGVTDTVELRRQAEWMGHRVYMARDKFGSKYDIPIEDWKGITIYDDTGVKLDNRSWAKDPAIRTNIEEASIDGKCAVWEIWNRDTGLVYTFIEGIPYPVTSEVPSVTWSQWFPFFFLWFNRVDGRAIPMSDTLLVRSLQDEVNRLRTQDLELRNAAMPRAVIRRGSMTPDEKEAYENSYPGQVLEMGFPDDIRKTFAQPTTMPYNPQLCDIGPAITAMEQMSGISRNAMGTPSGDVATTAAIAQQSMQTQMDLRRSRVEEFLSEIGQAMAEMANQIMPESNVKAIVGNGAVWPVLGRTDLFQRLKLRIKAGSTGKPDTKVRKEFFQILGPLCQQLSAAGQPIPIKSENVFRKLLDTYEITDDPSEMILTQQEQQQMAMMAAMGIKPPSAPPAGPGGSPAAAPRPPPPGAPGTEGGAAGPGAPPMADRSTPTPQQIPNGPMAKGGVASG